MEENEYFRKAQKQRNTMILKGSMIFIFVLYFGPFLKMHVVQEFLQNSE